MARTQFSRDEHFHVKIAALDVSGRYLVPGCRRGGPAYRRHHVDHGAQYDGHDGPGNGSPASHAECYSFVVGSRSATCSPAFTPLATRIRSPLRRPTSIARSSNWDPRHTYATSWPDL